MDNKDWLFKFSIDDFKVGDEVWWFRLRNSNSALYNFDFRPGDVELVHDTVKEIIENHIICWHSNKKPEEVWGKTRKQAWENLKHRIEKWGSLD